MCIRDSFKPWKGPFRVTKVLSRLNLKVQAGLTGKKMIVHVDRVRHMRLEDQEEAFCSNKARFRGGCSSCHARVP